MAGIGGVIGCALFCAIEVIPYAIRRYRWQRRRHERRAAAAAARSGDVRQPVSGCLDGPVRRCILGLKRQLRRRAGAPHGDLLASADVGFAVARQLRSSELCRLRQASRGLRGAAWNRDVAAELFIFGGESNCPDSVESLDPERGRWEARPQMPQRCSGAVGAALAGKFFVCGGKHGLRTLNTVVSFDPDSGEWSQQPSMLQERLWPMSCSMLGSLYVCGGKSPHGVLASVECFDPQVGQWELVASMEDARYASACAVLGGGLYVCGGLNGQRTLESAERYDALSNQWAGKPSMSTPRGWPASVVTRGFWYVLGGRCDMRILACVERFDRAELDKPWQVLPAKMSVGRYGAVSAIVAGKIYVVGGRDQQSVLADVEVFDPEGASTPGPSLLDGRARAVCAVLPWRRGGFTNAGDFWGTGETSEDERVDLISRTPTCT